MEFSYKLFDNVTLSAGADSDQAPQNVMSDQGLHRLFE